MSWYTDLFKHKRWQKKRLEVLQRDNWKCAHCTMLGSDSEEDNSTLHIHHRYYKGKRQPWEYPLESLVTLCAECHEKEEKRLKVIPDQLIQAMREACCGAFEFQTAINSFYELQDNPNSMESLDGFTQIAGHPLRLFLIQHIALKDFDGAREIINHIERMKNLKGQQRLDVVEKYRNLGKSEKEIAEIFGEREGEFSYYTGEAEKEANKVTKSLERFAAEGVTQ